MQERSDTVLTLSAGCPVGDYYVTHDIDVPEELVSAVLSAELEGVTTAELVCVCNTPYVAAVKARSGFFVTSLLAFAWFLS